MADQTWHELVFNSHYQATIAAKELLQEGKVMEAGEILEDLIEAMGRSEKRAVKSQLTRLMKHIIKWQCQPEKRSPSWVITIRSARREIADSQEEMPSLNRDFILSIWQQCFHEARQDARDEMRKNPTTVSLEWDEVFTQEYSLLNFDED
jgi:hypothetical protein